MKYPKLLLDTDVFVDYLVNSKSYLLNEAASKFILYTTVLNSAELYGAVADENEKDAVDKTLLPVKLLGFSGRYGEKFGEFYSSSLKSDSESSLRDAMFVGTAIMNKLPVLTLQRVRYGCFEAAMFVESGLFGTGLSASEIFRRSNIEIDA